MEVTPVVVEVWPVIGVTVAVAIPAAMVDAGRTKAATAINGRSAKAATVDRHPTAPEAAAVKRRAAASKSTAMKTAAAETSAAASKAATATAAKTAATMATATVPNFGRQPIGCILRSRHRAWTCE
jgi:hypothetical protein